MPPVRFGIYTLAGCAAWIAALAWAGYAVGANWRLVAGAFHGITDALAVVIIMLVVLVFALLVRRRIREHGREGGLAESHEGR
jgi:membrane protein DedA with SNARE-associated domain